MSDPRSAALALLAAIATRRAALAEVLSPFKTQIAAIERACLLATADEVVAIERLEEDVKRLGLAESDAVFGEDSCTLRHGNLSLGIRPSEKVEVIGDEDEVISSLQLLAARGDAASRLAAGACLRTKVELNKTFVRQQWAESPEWFELHGLRVTESLSVSLVEKKPAKAKPAKAIKAASESPPNE